MSYKKGKDIKVPFDCLWHYMTRSYQVFLSGNKLDSAHAIGAKKFNTKEYDKPDGFETIKVQDLQ